MSNRGLISYDCFIEYAKIKKRLLELDNEIDTAVGKWLNNRKFNTGYITMGNNGSRIILTLDHEELTPALLDEFQEVFNLTLRDTIKQYFVDDDGEETFYCMVYIFKIK